MYAERLKEIRKQLHYTVKEISDVLKIKERTYGSYERKENNVSIELVTSLCKNLNVNANWFCTGEGNMFNSAPENSATQTKQDKKELAEMVKKVLMETLIEYGGNDAVKKLLK
jgi:transcriptional regulator with XRE-family HTH domain